MTTPGLDDLDKFFREMFGNRFDEKREESPSATVSPTAHAAVADGPVPSRARWERDPGQYAIGSVLMLGRWMIGRADDDGMVERGDPKRWKASCYLPGIKRDLGRFATGEEARERVEKAVKVWMRGAFA